MAPLSPDQRNYYYLIEAARAGIHKPILAALYAVHSQPQMAGGENGLGIAPANRITIDQISGFPKQVQYAANTLRSLTDALITDKWQGSEIWDAKAGRYSDKFLAQVASGYTPNPADVTAAQLESSDGDALTAAYLQDIETDFSAEQLSQNLASLDDSLLAFAERVITNYSRLDFQRLALLEAVRLWRQLETHEAVYATLEVPVSQSIPDQDQLDQKLLKFIQSTLRYYSGYPNQREALIRLVQLWRELDSREETIAQLAADDPFAHETNLEIIDPALIAFVEKLPRAYQSRGDQRFALTEAYRLWNGLDSRSRAIANLGIDPKVLVDKADDQEALMNAARQIDRGLLSFAEALPTLYGQDEDQREALIRLIQIWRRLDGRVPTVQSLLEDIRRMERADRTSPDAMPAPKPVPQPARPNQWTPNNIQMVAAIIPNGNFTWAEATRGGTRMPPDQATVDAIVRIAQLAQQARDRISRPFVITSWYRPAEINRRVGGASKSRHIVGDAIDFYCNGLTGNQLYWALDPWWPGGLGRYSRFPYLCHLDAREYRARWTH